MNRPSGTQIIPHDVSMAMAHGVSGGSTSVAAPVNITINPREPTQLAEALCRPQVATDPPRRCGQLRGTRSPDRRATGLGVVRGLTMGRTGNGFGPNPLSNGEIESYARMAGEPIRLFEFDMLQALDRSYLEAARNGAVAEADPEKREPLPPATS
jgi:hypothetical protein